MAGLAKAYADVGHEVVFVAEREMSAERAAQGWEIGNLGRARLLLVSDAAAVLEAVTSAREDSIHICQGLRGNGLVGIAQRALASKQARQWVIMETVDEGVPPVSWAKNAIYSALARRWRDRVEGVLAIGHSTGSWLEQRGMPKSMLFPFTYFLPELKNSSALGAHVDSPYTILFVGQIIQRKRLDVLIDAVSELKDLQVRLEIVGVGELEAELRKRAEAKLGDTVVWRGRKNMSEIPPIMQAADCLVLPSRFDGWGAVASEAIMVGTPAVCSDRCGVASVVKASNSGGVFQSSNAGALAAMLRAMVRLGRQSEAKRRELVHFGTRLGSRAGASYLEAILAHREGRGDRPLAPWEEA